MAMMGASVGISVLAQALPAPEARQDLWREQRLLYHSCHGLVVVDREAIGLLSLSLGSSTLVRFPVDSPAKPKTLNLPGSPDGFAVAGDRVLGWSFSRGPDGRLSSIDLSTEQETELFTGTVLSTGRPVLRGDRIWWVTAVDGVPRVAYRDPSLTGARSSHPVVSPPLPESDYGRFQFTRCCAVFTSEEPRAGLWVWQRAQAWEPQRDLPTREIVGATGDSVLAVGCDGREVLSWNPGGGNAVWESVYTAEPDRFIDAASFRRSRDSASVAFTERTATGEMQVVRLSLNGTSRVQRRPLPLEYLHPAPTDHWSWDGDVFAAVRHHGPGLWLVSDPGSWRASSSGRAEAGAPPTRTAVPKRAKPVTPGDPAARGVRWLTEQLGPPLDGTGGSTARLIDSYEDQDRAGWTYDAALAAIALTATGERDLGRQLLHGLERLQEEDGSWAFSFDPDRGRPLGKKRYVGSMAWVIMAANFYQWETGDRRFAAMARRGLEYLAEFRRENPGQETHGAISMGPANPGVFSTEHNLDCYSAFLERGLLDGDARYQEIAVGIRRFILEVQWAETTMGPGQRFFKVGYRDAEFYLDAQSWSVLAFWNGKGDPPRVKAALETAERRLRLVDGRLGEITDIVGFNEAEGGEISDKVWAEGTEGMVAALHILGETGRAAAYHQQTARYQSASGGIPYATKNGDGWPTTPSVAATTWFVLNSLSPPRNPFQPRSGSKVKLSGSQRREDRQHLN